LTTRPHPAHWLYCIAAFGAATAGASSKVGTQLNEGPTGSPTVSGKKVVAGGIAFLLAAIAVIAYFIHQLPPPQPESQPAPIAHTAP